MQKASYRKRLLTFLLTLCMAVTYMPSFAFAADESVPPDTQQTEVTEQAEEPAGSEVTPAASEDTTEEAVQEQAEEPEPEKAASAPRKAPAATASEEDDDDAEPWQTEDIDLPDGPQEVKFQLEGTDSVEAWIEDVSESEFIHSDDGTMSVTFDQTIKDGDTKELAAGTTIVIKGIDGKALSAGFGEDEEDAKEIRTSGNTGEMITIGTMGKGICYIKVSDEVHQAADTEDEEGNAIWDGITAADEEGSYSGSGDPEVLSSLKAGDTFKGTAVLKNFTIKSHASTARFRATTGWLKSTYAKNISATCISGSTRAMGLVGSKFTYVAKIKSVDPKTGKTKVTITYYPKSHRANVSYGLLCNWHAKTQTFQATVTVSGQPQMEFEVTKKDTVGTHYNHPENYSLQNATFHVFTDSACTQRAKDVKGNTITLTTNASGKSSKVTVADGDYWIKETKASQGYMLDKSLYPVTLTEADDASAKVITSTEQNSGLRDFSHRSVTVAVYVVRSQCYAILIY